MCEYVCSRFQENIKDKHHPHMRYKMHNVIVSVYGMVIRNLIGQNDRGYIYTHCIVLIMLV